MRLFVVAFLLSGFQVAQAYQQTEPMFLQRGTGAVPRPLQEKLRERGISILDFNPKRSIDIGDGNQHPLSASYQSYADALADCPALEIANIPKVSSTGWQTEELAWCALTRAVAALPNGGRLYIPAGHYFVSSETILKTPRGYGWVIEGDGYNSVLQVRPGGWDTTTVSYRRGVFTMDHNYETGRYAGDIIFRELRFVGVQGEVKDSVFRPHAIYSSDASHSDGMPGKQPQYNVHITHCWMEAFDREAIWQSAWEGTQRWTINENLFRNVTTPAQLNIDGATFANNFVYWDSGYRAEADSGAVGLAATGRNMTVSGNTILYPAYAGIYAGDGHDISGVITNNHVVIAGNENRNALRACYLSSVSKNLIIANNFCRIEGTPRTVKTYGIQARYNGNVHVSNNQIEIISRGTGIDISSSWITSGYGDHSGTLRGNISSNTIRYLSQDATHLDRGISANGFAVNSNTSEPPQTIIYSGGNVIVGLDSNDVAIDFGDDEVTATVAGDVVEDAGQVIVRPHSWNAKSRVPIYDQTGGASNSMHIRSAQVGMLNFGSPKTLAISSDAIDLSGVLVGNGERRYSMLLVDTEGAAAQDDLATIRNGQDGDTVILKAAASSRRVRLLDTGNIALSGPVTFTNSAQQVTLVYSAAPAKWIPIAWNFYSPSPGVAWDFPGRLRIYDQASATGVSGLSIVGGAGQGTANLLEIRDGADRWSRNVFSVGPTYQMNLDTLTSQTEPRVLVTTNQSATDFLASPGQIVMQFRNRDTTNGNWTIQGFSDGAGTNIAALGARQIDHSRHYGALAFYTKGPDGFNSRLHIDESGNAGFGTTKLDDAQSVGRLTVKGSTSDGSSNILLGRDSNESNVFAVNTTGAISVASPGGPVATWTSYTIDFRCPCVRQSANAASCSLFDAPPKFVITGLRIKTSHAFKGAGLTGVQVSVGDGVTHDFYAPSYALDTVVSDANMLNLSLLKASSHSGGNVVARFTSTGGNLDTLTGGTATFWVRWEVLP